MRNLVVTDERIMSAEALYPQFKSLRRKKNKYSSALIAGDNSFLCDYFMFALNKANIKIPVFSKVAYVGDGSVSEYRQEIISKSGILTSKFNDVTNSLNENTLVFFFADCNDLINRDETVKKLKNAIALSRNGKIVLSVVLPDFESFSDMSGATSLAEREFSFYLENHCEKTEEVEYYLEIERICREVVKSENADVNILRFANVFAPDSYSCKKIDIESIVRNAVENKTITVTDDDCKDVFSVSYVRDACSGIFYTACHGKKGHIYNMSSCEITVGDIKEQIYSSYPGVFSLEKKLSSNINHRYYCLNTLKSDVLGNTADFDLSVVVKHIVSYLTEFEYDTSDNVSFYSGRIKQIQSLEIGMIQEIDRICVENDIRYFLAGGTLLGAVRSGEAISWDDDIDIGMLRKDFEKFRKVCEKELSPQFSYVTPYNGSGSHYIIEKVRLDGTYFSTKYSGANVFHDGVFVDVIVYDKTSNIKLFRNLHILILAVLYNCIILRWNPNPWKNKFHGIVKFIVPVLKLFPWGFYHRLFDFFAGIYKNKKNAKWLIDTVGKKLKDGPLPIDGLEDTVYVDFAGVKAPVPVDYTGYLTYAYGADYIEKPNLSNRKCPHDFARIDLGKYIFDINGETPFRDVDVRGELFEEE